MIFVIIVVFVGIIYWIWQNVKDNPINLYFLPDVAHIIGQIIGFIILAFFAFFRQSTWVFVLFCLFLYVGCNHVTANWN